MGICRSTVKSVHWRLALRRPSHSSKYYQNTTYMITTIDQLISDIYHTLCESRHSTKKPVTTMLTYPWKCTVLHCNHLGNTWKPLVLMTRHFDYCPSASEGDNQSVRSSAPVVSRCFPGGYNVKLYISRGRLAWWLLAFLHSERYWTVCKSWNSVAAPLETNFLSWTWPIRMYALTYSETNNSNGYLQNQCAINIWIKSVMEQSNKL